jgi:hypothetical protein
LGLGNKKKEVEEKRERKLLLKRGKGIKNNTHHP